MLSDRDPTEKKQILASISAELGYSLKQPEGEPSEAELDFFLQKLYGKRRITLLEKSQGAQME